MKRDTMRRSARKAAWGLPLLFVGGVAQAGGLYEVIPAELIDPRSGVFEFWHEEIRNDQRQQATTGALTFRNRALRQYRMELGTDGRQADDGLPGDSGSTAALEFVQLFRTIEQHGYGLGFAAQADYRITDYERTETFALIPLSVEWGERGLLTLNAGVIHDEEEREYERLRGISIERDFGHRWAWVLEVWDDNPDEPEEAKAGLQLRLMDELLTVNVTYGTRLTSDADDEYYLGLTFDALRF